MDLNPDSGKEIQDTCCGRIMVILKLKLERGKTKDDDAASKNITVTFEYDNHATMTPKKLVEPYTLRGDRVVSAD